MVTLPIVKVCVRCQPLVQNLPGVLVSHGYCRRHALIELEGNGLAMTPLEKLELTARRRAAVLAHSAAALILVLMTGCTGTLGKYQVPCNIENVNLKLMDDKHADNYCSTLAQLDPGETVEEGTYAKGCAFKKGDRAEVVLGETDNIETLVHEVRHLLDWFCQLKPGAKTPLQEWEERNARGIEEYRDWAEKNAPKEVR